VIPRRVQPAGRFNIVHLSAVDLSDPERKAMSMGVASGNAIMLDLPRPTTRAPKNNMPIGNAS
jgi:hypothetical protein